MEAADVERAALYGVSEGGPASLLFAATYPERVAALVIYGSTPRFSATEDFPWGLTAERREAIRRTRARSNARVRAATACARSGSTSAPGYTGKCEFTKGDVSGMAVNIGARVGSIAGPGQVLVSSTVKDLTVGADLTFAEHGEHELMGVPGSWRLFAVQQ